MFSLSEDTVRNGIIFLSFIDFLWETYLSIRQYNKAKATPDLPKELESIMTKDEFQKSRDYSLAKLRFGFVKDTQSIMLTTLVIHTGFLADIWDYSTSIAPVKSEVIVSCLWLLIISLATTFIDLPFTIYHTFILEEKFGFNKQTAGFFIKDRVKMFMVSQILTLSVTSLVIVIIKEGGPYFFVWLWAAVGTITFLLQMLYPTLIAPLFDKFTPLPEGELRTNIESLASDLKYPLTHLFVVEGSKRSSHSNAYLSGMFNSKRIVLFDTLLPKDDGTGCQNDEILAVLSHELGHWKHSHLIKNLIIIQVNFFLLFAGFSKMFQYETLYKAVGFYNSKPVLIGLYVVLQYVMLPYNAILTFLVTCLSRKFEFQADEFACKLNYGEPLERALIKLTKDNLGFPVNDGLYSAWHHSHPPVLERIEVIKQNSRKGN